MKKYIMLFSLLINSFSLFSNGTVEININGLRQNKTINVEKGITKLTLTKTESIVPNLINIEGLNHLQNLEELTIQFSNLTQCDFSFLDQIPNLKIINFDFISLNDFSFLEKMPNIKAIFLSEGIDLGNLQIDLSNNKNIEYIQIWGHELNSIPVVLNPPKSFKYLNIAWSNIYNLNLNSDYTNVVYILDDNDLKKMTSKPENFHSFSETFEEIKTLGFYNNYF